MFATGTPNPPLSEKYHWRDDRAAEGARLEVVCTRKGTEGSNPSLSERFICCQEINVEVLRYTMPEIEGFEPERSLRNFKATAL